MIRPNPQGFRPEISASAYIDPTATVIGKVRIGDRVFVGPYAVIRQDEGERDEMDSIVIGADSNIQDGVVLHSVGGARLSIGNRTTIAHRAIVHGPCEVGDQVLVGFNSVVFGGVIGDRCVIRHGSVVEHCELPADTLVPSGCRVGADSDIAALPKVDPQSADFQHMTVEANLALTSGYRKLQTD